MRKFTLVINNRVTISMEAVSIAGFLGNLASYGMFAGYPELWEWLAGTKGGGELFGLTIRAKLTVENIKDEKIDW